MGRTFRFGDDRGHGVRNTGAGHARRLSPGSGEGRRERVRTRERRRSGQVCARAEAPGQDGPWFHGKIIFRGAHDAGLHQALRRNSAERCGRDGADLGMSAKLIIAHSDLVEIVAPYPEPRLVYQSAEPRKVNNLTLIDGKTFLSTTVAGDIMPPGAPDVGFFHDDTRFLSRLELRVDGYRTVVLSSSTEQTFSSQIELTTGKSTMRETYEIPENTVHIHREQLLSSDTLYDNLSFENFNFQELELVIELAYEADFIDVFQVRGMARQDLGHYYQPIVRNDSIVFHYRGLDRVARETIIHLFPEPEL